MNAVRINFAVYVVIDCSTTVFIYFRRTWIESMANSKGVFEVLATDGSYLGRLQWFWSSPQQSKVFSRLGNTLASDTGRTEVYDSIMLKVRLSF